MMELVLATHNIHKRDELATMLSGLFIVKMLPDDFPEIEETGTTLEENALIKARAVHEVLRIPVVADDTGLEVEALGGAPGVYTARYAGPMATYADNCRKLLSALEAEDNRKAVFRTIICFIDDSGKQMLFEGKVEGEISTEERGSAGFGYDPVFIPKETPQKTFAELTAEEKNSLSHRGKAITAFAKWCKERNIGT